MKKILFLLFLLPLASCVKEEALPKPVLSKTREFSKSAKGIEVGLNLSADHISGGRYYIFIENERNIHYFGVFKFPDISKLIDEEGNFDILVTNKIIDQIYENYTHYRIFLEFDFWEGENLIQAKSEFNPTIRSRWFKGGKD